ncbi:MAG: FG-GAP repeat domain-containing protein, partial [Pyrinomonadaceae bacterium]
NGDGTFVDHSAQSGLATQLSGNNIIQTDYNNDGCTDILVERGGWETALRMSLLRNNCNGTFTDVTRAAGVDDGRWSTSAAWVDYDRDGYLDLFVANYVDLDLEKTPHPGQGEFCEWKSIPVMCGPRGLPKALNALYHNNGDGTFTDISESAGILKPGGRYGLGVVAADFDNDGWPDIYVACD